MFKKELCLRTEQKSGCRFALGDVRILDCLFEDLGYYKTGEKLVQLSPRFI